MEKALQQECPKTAEGSQWPPGKVLKSCCASMGLDIHCLVPLSCSTSFKSYSGLIAAMEEMAVHHTARRFGATVAGVKYLARIGLAAGVFAGCLSAHSETLRCNGHTLETGATPVLVRRHCGEPLLQYAYCAPVYHAPRLQRVPEPFASAVVPCLVVEEWLYNRGPGNLAATVRFHSGVVQSITYGARAAPP